jgi:hypothetical protein
MSIRILMPLAIVSLSLVWFGVAADSTQTQPAARPTLPGARAEIDAAKYPSLQAALDALPKEGGAVRIPPGTFEITQPLVVSRGDVLIQGSGTATHIKNVNADGQPALVVKHPDGEKVKADDKLWRVMLSNFRITGNEKSGHGIEAVMVN